jgi:hypothetical protein
MLVELHGGRFILESQVDKGTKAGFSLPVSRIITRKNRKKLSHPETEIPS